MKTCSDARISVNGFTINDVAKQKKSPKVIEIGRAGRAFLVTARRSNVKHRPIRIATKHAIVVFQSP